MYFDLSEEHLMIRQAARDFAQTELKPGVIERDEHQKFPAEQVKKLGELGFLGMTDYALRKGDAAFGISSEFAAENCAHVRREPAAIDQHL